MDNSTRDHQIALSTPVMPKPPELEKPHDDIRNLAGILQWLLSAELEREIERAPELLNPTRVRLTGRLQTWLEQVAQSPWQSASQLEAELMDIIGQKSRTQIDSVHWRAFCNLLETTVKAEQRLKILEAQPAPPPANLPPQSLEDFIRIGQQQGYLKPYRSWFGTKIWMVISKFKKTS